METKVKENGQANPNTVKTDKTQRFVAGNPVNAVSGYSAQMGPLMVQCIPPGSRWEPVAIK